MVTRPADNGAAAMVIGMRRFSLVLGAVVSLAAPLAGVIAYQSWAPGPGQSVDPVAATTLSHGSAEPDVRYRPCKGPARLKDGICVTHRVKVVVAPAAAAPISGTAPDGGADETSDDDASPARPVHHPPSHEADPYDDPTDEPASGTTPGPTVGPSAPPSCEPSDDGDGDEDGEQYEDGTADRLTPAQTAAGPLGWMAVSASPRGWLRAGDASTGDCHDQGEEEDEDGEEQEGGDRVDGRLVAD